jgi:hypothetical protein
MPRDVALRRSAANCPLYGISPLLLASKFKLDVHDAKRWKSRLRRKVDDAAAIAALVNSDLGAFDAEWRGFVVRDGAIWTPENVPVSPGEVRSVPHVHSQLAELGRQRREALETSFAEQRYERAIAEAEAALQRAIEALRQR